jgi:hypothetical protein
MQLLHDPGELAAGCHPPVPGHADLEAGSVAEMPVLP